MARLVETLFYFAPEVVLTTVMKPGVRRTMHSSERPVRQQHTEIGAVDNAVTSDVSGAANTRTPTTEKYAKIGAIDPAIAVQVARLAPRSDGDVVEFDRRSHGIAGAIDKDAHAARPPTELGRNQHAHRLERRGEPRDIPRHRLERDGRDVVVPLERDAQHVVRRACPDPADLH